MRVLAVDTTTERESVALAVDGEVTGEVRLRARGGHSRRLMPAISFLLGAAGLSPREVDGFAVTIGPGSFTGLRVGISCIQGLALASGRPCLGVDTLEVLARAAGRGAGVVAATVDAYRGQVYAALHDASGARLDAPRAESPEALASRAPENVAFIGDGADKHRDVLAALRPRAVFLPGDRYLAATLARMAAPRLQAGEGVPAAALRALYLREADIGQCRPA